MKSFVQTARRGQPIYPNLERDAHAFWERGYEIIRFDPSQVEEGVLDEALIDDPNNCVVRGGAALAAVAMRRAGRPDPPNIDLPESLAAWIGRRFWLSTFQEARDRVCGHGETVHIKPAYDQKRFTGFLATAFRDFVTSAHVDPETVVLVQEPVTFVSEWRAYVLRGEIINVSHYRGDPLSFPDRYRMTAALAAYDEQPIALAMDWGVTAEGQSVIVELNDAFALGNYGVPMMLFTAMLESRWRELMGLSDNGVGEPVQRTC